MLYQMVYCTIYEHINTIDTLSVNVVNLPHICMLSVKSVVCMNKCILFLMVFFFDFINKVDDVYPLVATFSKGSNVKYPASFNYQPCILSLCFIHH